MSRQMQEQLARWGDRYEVARSAAAADRERMSHRKARLDGTHEILNPDGTAAKEQATHCRNLCFEMIETQVDSSIPVPKVTAVREADEHLAKEIEDMLRNMLDRLPTERINDEDERVCPTQGGDFFHIDWDTSASGKGWIGNLVLTLRHPVTVTPQPGVYSIGDMDYIFADEGITKQKVRRLYGVDMENEGEENPEARGLGAKQENNSDLLTLHTAYFRNDQGGIGRFRWINDTPLEYLEDYQVRRVQRCRKCGRIGNGRQCDCGSRSFEEELQTAEVLEEDLKLRNGTVIPAMSPARDEFGQIRYDEVPVETVPMPIQTGLMPQMDPGGMPVLQQTRLEVHMEPTKLPYYKPNLYPLILRRNVSRPGQLLGSSDIDALEDAQNALNKICTKINSKTMGGGSFTTKKAGMTISDGDNRTMDIESPADLECVRVFNTQVDTSQDLQLRAQLYEEGRQTIGVTDSMQGRHDPTATSRVAKEFAAQQAAGRLESKKVMKGAAWADIFEAIFKFMLAYADEPRSMNSFDEDGSEVYTVFDRHDFLYQDDDGSWKYNDDFLFSVDTAAPLASNRQALWQETRMNFETGALGNPQDIRTQIRFWEMMDKLHYPLAKQTLAGLREQKDEEAQLAQQMAAMPQMGGPNGMPGM